MEDIEKLVPNTYQFKCYRDPKTSGRFEVTVFNTAEDLEKDQNGTVLHSKAASGKFPKNHNFEEFNKAVKSHATPV